MGQKVNPIGLRLGITQQWRSRWFADKRHFGEYVVEDQRIRRFIKRNYYYAGITKTEIERASDFVQVKVFTARPGLIIGRRGVEVEKLQRELEELIGRKLEISVEEVRRPELSAQLVAEEVAQQIERRTSFRRAMRRCAEMTMSGGAGGVKIRLAGRLGGSEMSRAESVLEGSIPLHTLRADIDYGFTEARTKYGRIGIKVWIYRGMLPPGKTIGALGDGEQNAPDA